uniref:LP07070p n=1 Tax=Drosophila melanogaster TaxID=7227 RepID=Q8MS68_DROME|nr:LP07070p [Drosophila melanogaster]
MVFSLSSSRFTAEAAARAMMRCTIVSSEHSKYSARSAGAMRASNSMPWFF